MTRNLYCLGYLHPGTWWTSFIQFGSVKSDTQRTNSVNVLESYASEFSFHPSRLELLFVEHLKVDHCKLSTAVSIATHFRRRLMRSPLPCVPLDLGRLIGFPCQTNEGSS